MAGPLGYCSIICEYRHFTSLEVQVLARARIGSDWVFTCFPKTDHRNDDAQHQAVLLELLLSILILIDSDQDLRLLFVPL